MTGKQKNIISLSAITITAAACFIYFQTQLPCHFFYKEQNMVFVLSGDYISSYFDNPAWLACMAGDFLTQFYYYLYAGAAILSVSILTAGLLCRQAVRRIGTGITAATAISLIVMAYMAVCSFHYSYQLSSVYSVIMAFTIYLAFAPILNSPGYYAVCAALILSPMVYWLCGYGLWIFHALLITRLILLLVKKQATGIYSAVTLLPLISIPLILGMRYHYPLSGTDALTFPGTGRIEKPNYALERYLAVDNEFYFGRYNNVIQLADNMENPLEQTLLLRNLAMAMQNRLTEVLTSRQKPALCTFITVNDKTPILTINLMNEFYYAIGDMTMTERAAMIAMVFSPKARNARCVKRLAEANLVSGDTAAAMKFLRILDKTIVYHQWARNHIPATQTAKVKAEMTAKAKLLPVTDSIRLNDDCRTILTNLLDANPGNTIALDYLLCSDMLAGQQTMFVDDYNEYGPRPKSIYLQALESASTSHGHTSQVSR